LIKVHPPTACNDKDSNEGSKTQEKTLTKKNPKNDILGESVQEGGFGGNCNRKTQKRLLSQKLSRE